MLLTDTLERLCMEQADVIEKQAELIKSLSTEVAHLTAVAEGEKENE